MSQQDPSLPGSLRQALRRHRPLQVFTLVMLAVVVLSLAGLVFDSRELGNAPIWAKPFKFGISGAVYGVTLAWLCSLLVRARRWGWWLGTACALSFGVDVICVVIQVVRGQASHFNAAKDPFDHVLLQDFFASSAMLLLMANLVLAIIVSCQRIPDPSIRWALRGGYLLSFTGMCVGFLMFGNVKPEQLAAVHAGTGHMLGGHSVGVPDGGPGLPLTYWSTTGGDLRIPHFFGIHALQTLPLLALGLIMLAGRFRRLRDPRVRLGLTLIGIGTYSGLFALLLWQALRGQPLIHPDGVTLAVLAALLGLATAGTSTVLAFAASQPLANQPL